MKKHICSICGYVYDESVGDTSNGVLAGTMWKDVPEEWACPLCGADKSAFEELKEGDITTETTAHDEDTYEVHEDRELSFGELSALCSSLSNACEKQYRHEEADLFKQLSEYYKKKVKPIEDGSIEELIDLVQKDLEYGYPNANKISKRESDRGALRSLAWGEKATKILSSLLTRHEKQGSSALGTNIYICEICGFIYSGEESPEICPVCKVPKLKIAQV